MTGVGLLAACDDPALFGFTLWPGQRPLLEEVERGPRLHVWALGRRSGKSTLSALVCLWGCLLRPELDELVRPGERRYSVAVATSLRQARLIVDAAKSIVEASPLLAGMVEQATDDELAFRNGTVLAAFPCTSRGGRGWPISTLVLDEAAHHVDGDGNSAAESVMRAMLPATAQFGDLARVVVASTPWGNVGVFADLFRRASRGELAGAAAAHATTAEANPTVDAAFLAAERDRDPTMFATEYEAQFVGGGAFLSAEQVERAVDESRFELRGDDVVAPMAALDVAFAKDATGLVIVGHDRVDRERLRLAAARTWEPAGGEMPFQALIDDVVNVCRDYGVRRILVDQYASVPVREALRRAGLHAVEKTITSASKPRMFGALKTALHQGTLELYRHPLLLAELARIEAHLAPGGTVQIRIARIGASHGDLASALAMLVDELAGGGTTGEYTSFVARGSLAELERQRQARRHRPAIAAAAAPVARVAAGLRPVSDERASLLVRDPLVERLAELGIHEYDGRRQRR